MNDSLQRLSHVDLDTTVRELLGFLETVDPCFLGLIVAVLVFIGSRMVSGQPGLQRWGLRLAAASFLIYGGFLWLGGKFDQGIPTWRLGARCGGVAGIVLAVSWIVLPVLSFVHRRLRLALTVFLGYGGYIILTTDGFTGDDLPSAALQGLIATALALVVAWIIDPVWTALTHHLLPLRTPMDRPSEQGPSPVPVSAPVRPTMLAPAPALLSSLGDDQETQRRRDRARMQLELAYLQAMPGICAWMPRSLFDDFLRRHLGDHIPPQDVEDNAHQLLAVLRQHQEQVHERADFGSLEDLANWLLTEQQRIQSLALDQPLKQTQLLDLHQRYLLLATRMVQNQKHALTAV